MKGKTYQKTFSCSGEIVKHEEFSQRLCFLQQGRVDNSPTMKTLLCLICGTEARAYLRS